MATLTLELSESLHDRAQDAAKLKGYSDVASYIEFLIRREVPMSNEEIEKALLEGIESMKHGECVPFDEKWMDGVRERAAARVRAKGFALP